MPNPIVCAYAAGIVDGEGYIGISKHKAHSGHYVYRVQLEIGMCDKQALQLIAKTFSHHIITVARSKPRKHIYRIRLSANRAVDFLWKIYPYLRVKTKQAQLCFELCDIISKRNERTRFDNRIVTQQSNNRRDRLYKECCGLNGK